MKKYILCILVLLAVLFQPAFSATNNPAFIVTPFTTNITVSPSTGTDVIIAVQNNTKVNQTITNLTPLIPPGSSVTAALIDNFCMTLAPGETCEASYKLFGLNEHNSNNLNISICSFNGLLCSRIKLPLQVKTAPLTNIFVFPTKPSIAVGIEKQFQAIGVFGNSLTQDITQDVTWTSSDETKATISNSTDTKGLTTAIAAGSSIIKASLNNLNGSSTLTVTPAALTSITVTPVNPSIAKGTKQQFAATGIYSDNTHHDLTSQVNWGTDDTSIATISNSSTTKGEATANNIGQTNINATFGSVTGSTTIHVTAATLTSISVTPTNPSASKGTTQPFTATGIYSDSTTANLTNQVTWNTGSASIAIISNHAGSRGTALAVNIGTTPVTATLNSIVGTTNIQVTPAVLTSIDVSPHNQTLKESGTEQYVATGVYTDHSTQTLTSTVTWQSTNPAIASVSNSSSSKGLATAVSPGSVNISATLDGIVGQTGLTVNPATLVSISVTPTSPSIANGTQLQFSATGTYSNSKTRDLTTVSTWLSSQPSVAILSHAQGSEGLATSVSTGSTLISAWFEGIQGSTTLTVTPAALTSIEVTPSNATLPKGTDEQYTAIGTYTDASTKNITTEVTWNSTTASVATISNASGSKGLATGVRDGSSVIQAISNSIVGSTPVTVITLKIGDSYDGGVVACLSSGLQDFIVTTVDNVSGIVWSNTDSVTDAHSTVDGLTNTTTIVNKLGAGTTYAAGLCNAYEIDSQGNSPCHVGNTCYNDWFLPSTSQLACMRTNKNKIGGFSSSPYWSSTENASSPATTALYYDFKKNNGPLLAANKSSSYRVRCARLIIS